MDPLTLIVEALSPLATRQVLDVGCGAGSLAKALVLHGARVCGIDPNPDAVAAAARAAPQAAFETASAEAMPFSSAAFDGVVFLNSLHHVPTPRRALAEARRVLRSEGTAIIVEPLARGTSYAALQPIEDEAAIRAEARDAIASVIAAHEFHCIRDVVFERIEVWSRIDDFLARAIAVAPARAQALDANRPAVIATFEAVAERDEAGRYILRQPLRAHVLATT